jgi:hypothetical protein
MLTKDGTLNGDNGAVAETRPKHPYPSGMDLWLEDDEPIWLRTEHAEYASELQPFEARDLGLALIELADLSDQMQKVFADILMHLRAAVSDLDPEGLLALGSSLEQYDPILELARRLFHGEVMTQETIKACLRDQCESWPVGRVDRLVDHLMTNADVQAALNRRLPGIP